MCSPCRGTIGPPLCHVILQVKCGELGRDDLANVVAATVAGPRGSQGASPDVSNHRRWRQRSVSPLAVAGRRHRRPSQCDEFSPDQIPQQSPTHGGCVREVSEPLVTSGADRPIVACETRIAMTTTPQWGWKGLLPSSLPRRQRLSQSQDLPY